MHGIHRSARFGLVAAILFSSLTSVATAAAGGESLTELTQAQSRTAALASAATSPSIQLALTNASNQLASATAQSLWADSNDPMAPPYGMSVFDASRQALGDLQSVLQMPPDGSVTVSDVQAVEVLVVSADKHATDAAIGLAAPAHPDGLEAARSLAADGDRLAARGHDAAALQRYASAWELAYRALTRAVVARTTSISRSTLMAGAQAALPPSGITLVPPTPISNAPLLTADGKPEVLYVGVEACPFCAVERWALVLALSQFGHFDHLSLSQSASFGRWIKGAPSPYDSFTFYGSKYHSPYISFTPVEWATNQPGNNFFGLSPLQSLTPDQAHVVDTYNPFCQRGGFEAGGGCPVPYVDVGNRYFGFSGADRSYIAGLSWWQIASGLADPTVTSTVALDGAAALLIGEICSVTENRPAEVCNNPVIQRYTRLDNGQA